MAFNVKDLLKSFITSARKSAETAGSFFSYIPQDNKKNRLPDPSTHSYDEYLRKYTAMSWVYSCVSLIAETGSSFDFLLKNEAGKTINKHELLDLIYKPNQIYIKRDFMALILQSLELAGNAYILKDDYVGKKPRKLYVLNPAAIEIKTDKQNGFVKITGYKYGDKFIYKPEDIIHIKYSFIGDMFYGLSPIAAARVSVDTYQAGERCNQGIFDNSARPEGIIAVEGNLTPEDKKRILKDWDNRHLGEDKAHRIGLITGGKTQFLNVGMSQRDMDFINGMKFNRDNILAIFKVPPALVGSYEHAPQFNTREQQRIFYNTCILPKLSLIYDTLTEVLLPLYGLTGYYIVPDTSKIASILSYASDNSAAAVQYQQMGFSANEIIDELGLNFPKTEEGNKRNTPQYLLNQGQSFGGSLLSAPRITNKDVKSAAFWKARQAERVKASIPFQSTVAEIFAEHFKRQAKEWSAAILKENKPLKYSDVFEKKKEIDAIYEAKRPALISSLKFGYADENEFIAKILRRSVSRGMNYKAVERVEKWVNVRAFKWAQEVEQTTLESLDAHITALMEAGESIPNISKIIGEELGVNMADYRTLRIARTEVIGAFNEAALMAYKDEPVIGKKNWLHSGNPEGRESHKEAGIRYGVGRGIPIDDDFEVGGKSAPAPCQFGDPAEDINCQCVIAPDITLED